MRKIITNTFVTLDGVIQAPGGPEEDRTGGFEFGGWSFNYWDDVMGQVMGEGMSQPYDLLLGRKTYVTHAQAFEPLPAGDFFGDLMNAPKKYVVSRTLKEPIWRDTTIIRDNVVEAVRALKQRPGKKKPPHESLVKR